MLAAGVLVALRHDTRDAWLVVAVGEDKRVRNEAGGCCC
jgi:hypothetical protein